MSSVLPPGFGQPKPKSLEELRKRRTLIVVVALAIAAILVVSVVLDVLYTDPLVSERRKSVTSFGNTTTSQLNPPGPSYAFYESPPDLFCRPSNAVGNLSVSLVWNSVGLVTSAEFYWIVPIGSFNFTGHIFYWANNTTSGRFSPAPDLEASICGAQPPVFLVWQAQAGVVITFSGISEYNYTVTEPIL